MELFYSKEMIDPFRYFNVVLLQTFKNLQQIPTLRFEEAVCLQGGLGAFLTFSVILELRTFALHSSLRGFQHDDLGAFLTFSIILDLRTFRV